MEESVSGFRVRGSWGDVVEHGERVTRALRDLARDDQPVPEPELEEWDEWRPKQHERLHDDVNEKTAEQAAVEDADTEPNEDLQTAGERLADSYDNLDDPGEAVEGWRDSVGHLARAADSAGRKALRAVEGAVYRNVMTQVSPYYFDNDLVSANVYRAGDDEYVLEVKVNDDDLEIRVSNLLADFEGEVDRWHVDTEKVTETVEAAEGVETPHDDEDEGEAGETEGRSHPDTT